MIRKKIVAIPGSTRKGSTNLNLIKWIGKRFSSKFDLRIYQGISGIPHFNPDLDKDDSPQSVKNFRNLLREADGILICTPEYAMGVPGTLKNAIDWTVSSMEFHKKPVALITAASAGKKSHASLMETLKVIESDIPESSQLVISFVQTKVKGEEIVDAETLEQVKKVMESLSSVIEHH